MAHPAEHPTSPPSRVASFGALRTSVARLFMHSGMLGWGNSGWPGGEATRLRQRIERLVPGDASRASEMYAARFGHGKSETLGQLGWLKHFTSSGKALHALYASELIRKWSLEDQSGQAGGPAAMSLIALCVDGFDLAAKGPMAFAADYLQIVTRQVRKVFAWQPAVPEEKLLRAIALTHALVSMQGFEAIRPRLKDAFDATLPDIVLSDGGVQDGSPESLLRLTLQVLPLRTAMQATREAIPASLNSAIERMLPMLRMLRHDNGNLAGLRGSGPHPEATAIALAADDIEGTSLSLARQSGFARLHSGHATLIADTTPQSGFAFELSIAGHQVFVSSHTPAVALRRLATESPAELLHVEEGQLLITGARLRNISVQRNVFMAEGGTDIRIEDSAEDTVQAFSVNITCQPDVDFVVHDDAAVLTLPDGSHWRLRLHGASLHKSHAGHSLIMIATPVDGSCSITWALQKI